MTAPEPLVVVPVPLPRSIYRILVSQADEAGIQVGPLIARGLVRALRPRKKARRARRMFSPELEAQIREHHARGVNDTTIARELGLSQPTVSRWRRELKLPTVPRSSLVICDVTDCTVPALTALAFRAQAGHVHVCRVHERIDREHADVVASQALVAGQPCPWGCGGGRVLGTMLPTLL